MNNIQYYSGAIDAGSCVSNGWDLVKRNYGLYFGISLLAIVLSGCVPCVSFFLVGPITGGIFYVFLREMRGEPVDFGMMFRGFDKFVPLMVVGLIQSIPEIIGQIIQSTSDVARIVMERGVSGSPDLYQANDPFPVALAGGLLVIIIIVGLVLMVFGIVWKVLFFFAIPLVMEYDLGAIDAMKLSAKAATSNVGGLILLFILEAPVLILGVLMICIGVFFVLPIIFAANAFAYRYVFPDMGWAPRYTVPPSPDIYGGSFGRGQ